MVTNSTTKDPKDLEIENFFLILSHNDKNIKQLLYFLEPITVPHWLIEFPRICPMFPTILMFLIVTTSTLIYFSLLPIRYIH